MKTENWDSLDDYAKVWMGTLYLVARVANADNPDALSKMSMDMMNVNSLYDEETTFKVAVECANMTRLNLLKSRIKAAAARLSGQEGGRAEDTRFYQFVNLDE